MKQKLHLLYGIVFLAVAMFLLTAASAQAMVLTFDPNADGGATGGTGAWDVDTATADWWDETLPGDNTWFQGEDAVFSGDVSNPGAWFVNLADEAVAVHNMSFVSGDTYTVRRYDLDLVGTAPTISVVGGTAASINTVLIGSAGMNKSGLGALNMNVAATYTGGTTLNDGILLVNAADALPTAENITVLGGELQVGVGLTQNSTGAVSLLGGLISGNIINKTGGGNYDVQQGSVSGILNGSVGLTKSGTGTVTLTAANGYTGGTIVQDGLLAVSGANDRLSTAGDITITGGVLDLGGTAITQNTSGAISFQGGTVQNGVLNKSGANYDGQAGIVSAILQGTVGLTKSTAGVLDLRGANTYTGKTAVNVGSVRFANGTAFGPTLPAMVSDQVSFADGTTIIVATNQSASNQGWTITGNVTFNPTGGTRSIGVVTGTGNFILNSTDGNRTLRTNGQLWTYTGDTIVIQGSLGVVNGNAELPSGWVGPQYTGDLYLDYNVVASTRGTLNLNNHNVYQNSLRDGPNGGGELYNGSGSSARPLYLGYLNHSGSFSGTASGLTATGGRGVSINKTGTGTQIFSGNLSAGINSMIASGGTLKIMSTCVFQAASTSSVLQADAGAILDITDFGAGGATYGLATQSQAKTVRGSGTIAGKLTVMGNSTNGMYTSVAPGTSAGTLTISDIVFDVNSQLTAEVGAAGDHDLLNATNSIVLNGGRLNLQWLAGYAGNQGDTWDIIDWGGGGITGAFSSITTNVPIGWSWDTSNVLTTGQVTLIPEPATWAMLVLAAMGWFVLRKRR